MAAEKTTACPACGALNPADYAFCFHCRMPAAEAVTVAPKKKPAAKISAKKRSTRKK